MSEPIRTFIDTLSRCRRVLVTTHVRPDGDALGTVAALVLGLRRKGIDATVLLLSKLPAKYAFLLDENEIRHVESFESFPATLNLGDFDALLVADTGTWSQLPGLRPRLEGWTKPKLVLDHHLTQEDWATAKVVDTSAAAAAEVAADVLRAWGVPLDAAIATALYVALVSDTGWFQFSNTRPRTLRLAADLIEAGVDTDALNVRLNQSERKERVFLQTRATQSLRLSAGDRLAVMTVRKSDFEASGAGVPATENLINVPLQIGSVEVSVLAVEPPDGAPTRVSLRSKGKLDCAAFAERFGGGGHARASGMKFDEPLDAAVAKVVDALEKALA